MKTSTMELLESHPLTVKMREDAEAEILAVRQNAFEGMVLAKDEASRQAEELKQKIAKAQAALEAKQAALASAKNAVLKLQAERRGILAGGERVEREQSQTLLDSYDPRLDEARTWFLDKQAEIRQMDADQQTRLGKKNLVTDEREKVVFTNARFVREAVLYCTEAIREIEQLRLLPEYPADRIEELKANVPDVTQFEEISSKRLEKDVSYTKRLRDFLPSDDYFDWAVSTTLEKAKELLRKPAASAANRAKTAASAAKTASKRSAAMSMSELPGVIVQHHEKRAQKNAEKKKGAISKAVEGYHAWRDAKESHAIKKALQ